MTKESIGNHLWLAVIAGGQGTRLFPLSNEHCPKQFCQLDNDNTFIQATVKRFYEIGVKANHVIVVTTTDRQTELATKQLTPLGVISPNIYQIEARYGYAGAMVKAAEFIYEQDPEAVIINTPSDQFISRKDGFDSFIDSMKLAIRSAEGGLPTIVGVKIRDLVTFVGCGHAVYDDQGPDFCKKVVNFVEKPDEKTAKKMMRADNSVCNTGINVWTAETILNATSSFNLERDTLNTDDLMSVLGELRVAIGEFDWHDCGTLKSLWEVSAKTPNHHNASLGRGYVDRTECLGSLFIAPEGVEIYATDIEDGSVVVSEIDGFMYVACVAHEECQLVRQLVDHYQSNKRILSNDYSVKSRNCIVERTNFSDQIRVSFVGMDYISISAIKNRNDIIQITVSKRAENSKI